LPHRDELHELTKPISAENLQGKVITSYSRI
jgi:hypothetical protein